MKFRVTIAVLFLILASTLLLGQNRSDTPVYNTLLFKITNPNSSKTSYLFGTHHAFGKRFFDSLTVANKALSSCEILIKENLNVPGHLAQDIINDRATRTKWDKYLTKDNLNFIKNLFSTSPTDYNKMTPTEMYAFLNRHYKQQVCLNKAVKDTSQSLDNYIGAKAQQLNMELIGLETTQEQIILINKDVEGMPRKVHKRRLSNIIEKIESKNPADCVETNWYLKMEIDYQLKQPCTNTLILTNRNEKWMKTILQWIEKNNCFIAVGLSHLMYECGLINALQNLGYGIEPINTIQN